MNAQDSIAVQLRAFGGPDELEIVTRDLPEARRGEVRVRVLAAGVEYTEVLIRRHVYPQTWFLRPPFVMGYDLVGDVDQVGEGVTGFRIGDRVAAMTVVGADATHCTVKSGLLVPVPSDVDPAEAAALVLSWTTAYQLLHRVAKVKPGQRVLVHGAAGAVGQALLALGQLAGLKMWGTVREENAARVREFGAQPVDYQREDFARAVPDGYDVIVDGIAEDGYRRSRAALAPKGHLYAIGFSSAVQARRGLPVILFWIARLYAWNWLSAGPGASFFSVNFLQFLHPGWFREDLATLFGLLAAGKIHPCIARRMPLEQAREAHRLIEGGGLDGKLILCPGLNGSREIRPGSISRSGSA